MEGTSEIKTDRLLLRRYRTEDANELYEMLGKDPQMYKYSGWNPYADLNMASETVRRFIDSYGDTTFYGWKLVGTIGTTMTATKIKLKWVLALNAAPGDRALPQKH